MTEEQRSILLGLKTHIDQVNRTGTLNIPPAYFAQVQEVARQLEGRPIDSCRSCMIDAIKRLYRRALHA